MKFEDAAIKILEELDKKGDQFTKKEDLKRIKIGKNKLEEVLNYASHKRLIIYHNGVQEVRISPAEGRDYLMTTKSTNAQQEFNKMVAFTGAIVALTSIYDFIVKSTHLENYPQSYWIITIIFLALLVTCIAPLATFIFNYWKREVFG